MPVPVVVADVRLTANGIRSTSTVFSPAASAAIALASTDSRVAATSSPRSAGCPSAEISSIGKKSSTASSTGSGRRSCTRNGRVSRTCASDIFGTTSSRMSTCWLPMPMTTFFVVNFASAQSRRSACTTTSWSTTTPSLTASGGNGDLVVAVHDRAALAARDLGGTDDSVTEVDSDQILGHQGRILSLRRFK